LQITDWKNSESPGEFTASEIGINMDVSVEGFTYRYVAGEDRLYYSLSLSEYRPYGAKIIVIKAAETPTTEATVAEAPRVNNAQPVEQTYTVKSGDSLWKITSKLTGNGSNWNALYQANKAVIGGNPNLIKTGQVFVIPQGWQS
jgi:hypothetical protein